MYAIQFKNVQARLARTHSFFFIRFHFTPVRKNRYPQVKTDLVTCEQYSEAFDSVDLADMNNWLNGGTHGPVRLHECL